LIEGDTERLLITAMLKKYDVEHKDEKDYVPLLSQNISVIEVGAYSHVFQNFLNFLEIKSLIITDLDCCKKNGKGRNVKCPFNEATVTSNTSLKYFLNKENLDEIIKVTDAEKVFIRDDDKWIPNSKGSLRLAFQVEENGYTARSFEDAFLAVNLSFISDNKEQFQSLENQDKVSTEATDYYDIANSCIKSKTGFALDILLHSDEDYTNWETPKYIKDGLEWLKK
jgi:hypothetical protein